MKAYRSILVGVVLCVSFLLVHSYAATDKNNEITIVIPARVLQGFINEVLPVEIPRLEKVSGVLRIRSVEHLRLGLDKVWFTATIRGENIAYKGKSAVCPRTCVLTLLKAPCSVRHRFDTITKKGCSM